LQGTWTLFDGSNSKIFPIVQSGRYFSKVRILGLLN